MLIWTNTDLFIMYHIIELLLGHSLSQSDKDTTE